MPVNRPNNNNEIAANSRPGSQRSRKRTRSLGIHGVHCATAKHSRQWHKMCQNNVEPTGFRFNWNFLRPRNRAATAWAITPMTRWKPSRISAQTVLFSFNAAINRSCTDLMGTWIQSARFFLPGYKAPNVIRWRDNSLALWFPIASPMKAKNVGQGYGYMGGMASTSTQSISDTRCKEIVQNAIPTNLKHRCMLRIPISGRCSGWFLFDGSRCSGMCSYLKQITLFSADWIEFEAPEDARVGAGWRRRADADITQLPAYLRLYCWRYFVRRPLHFSCDGDDGGGASFCS